MYHVGEVFNKKGEKKGEREGEKRNEKGKRKKGKEEQNLGPVLLYYPIHIASVMGVQQNVNHTLEITQ